MVLATAEEFVKQQEIGLKQIRLVSQSLFEIAEQLAVKQIESDPKDFMLTQLKQSMQEDEFLDVIAPDGDGYDIVLKVDELNTQEESKELTKSKKYLTARFSSLKQNNAGTR